MKSKQWFGTILCGLVLIAMAAMLAGCGAKNSSKKNDTTPSPKASEGTPTPGATKTPAATATPAATPTETPEPTPTNTPTPTATPQITPIVANAFNVEIKEYAGEEAYFPGTDRYVYTAEFQEALRRLKVTYTTTEGKTAEFDSQIAESYKARMEEQSQKVYDELKAGFDGKIVSKSTLLQTVLFASEEDVIRLDIFERAAYGYADVVYEADRKNAKQSPVFNYRIEYRLCGKLREDDPNGYYYGNRYVGTLCDVTKSENPDETGKFTANYVQYYDMYADWAMKGSAVCLYRETDVKEEDSESARKGTRIDAGTVIYSDYGNPLVYLEESMLRSGNNWFPIDALLYTPDGKVCFSEQNEDWQILDKTASKFKQNYETSIALADGASLKLSTGVGSVYWLLEGGDNAPYTYLYESYMKQSETLLKDSNSLYVEYRQQNRKVDYDLYNDVTELRITEQVGAAAQKEVKFESERYRAENLGRFRESAENYEKSLRSEYKGKVLFREKKLDTVSFDGLGQVDICEVAAIGDTSQYGKTRTLYYYCVYFRFHGEYPEKNVTGVLFESDKYGTPETEGCIDRVVLNSIFHVEDPLNEVRIRRYKPGVGLFTYSSDTYDTVAYFDENGKAVMYAEDCWGEATDWFRVPGKVNLRDTNGKVYYSYNDNIILDYKISDIAETIADLYKGNGKVNYHGMSPDAFVKDEDGSYHSTKGEKAVNQDLSVGFAAYGSDWYTTFRIYLRYKGAEMTFAEERYYIPNDND